jgi:tetratricopeptide (TPR) repeat protein
MAASRDKILREAEKLVQRGKVEQAIREYEKLLKQNPTDANTINRVGDLYGRVGQIDKAVELYERIAQHFTQDGFTTKAIAILKKINRLAPQRLDIFDQLADLYIQQGLMVEAKSQFQILADWYVKNGDHEKAVEIHKKLVQLDPHNHMAHLRLADLLMQGGEGQEALEVYERLGIVLLEREKLDEAERLYRHALDQDPPDGEFLVPLCEALLDSGRTAVAREFLQAAVQRSPDSRALKLLEVRAHLAFGESEEALDKASGLLEIMPDDLEVCSLVARALLSSGEAAKAREMLLPNCKQLVDRGEFGAAQKLLDELLESLPQDQEVLNLAVRAYRPSGDHEKLANLTESLADSCFRSDQHEQAQHLYMELLESEPQNDLFRERLAQIQGVEPDQVVITTPVVEESVTAPEPASPVQEPESAVDEPAVGAGFEVFEAAEDEQFDPEERLAEAKVFAKYGLLEKATSHLEEIIRFFPEAVEARAILVSLYVEQDEKQAALPVAQPLYERYRQTGDTEALQALLTSLPELDGAAEMEFEAVGEVDEDVIVLDLDEALAVSDGAEPVEAVEPPEELEEQIPEPEPVEIVAEVVDEPLDEEFVIDLDAEQPTAMSTESPMSAEPVVPVEEVEEIEAAEEVEEIEEIEEVEEIEAAEEVEEIEAAEEIEAVEVADDEMLFDDEEEVAEELVEISSSFTGPSMADLDQLDFFIDQDLHEDAIRLLGRLESEFPEDPEVSDRRLALKAKGVLLEEVVAVTDEPEELFADEDESYVDLAKELELEMAEEEAMVDEATGRGKEEALLEEVFREFQKGVAEQLSDADSDTHFNLGIAYKEMGLLPEAIREFQVASRDSNLFVECCSMIGVCYVEQGMWSQAADWYQKALDTPDLVEDAQMALRYDLASALESGGENERAAGLFEAIAAANPAYRDVANRLSTLGEHRQAN